jgi:hypothetical protein
MANARLDGILQAIGHLQSVQDHFWEERSPDGPRPKKHVRDIYDGFISSWDPLRQEHLDRIRTCANSCSDDFEFRTSSEHSYLYLPVPERDASLLPILDLALKGRRLCDQKPKAKKSVSTSPMEWALELRILLLHCRREDESALGGETRARPHGIVLRLEGGDCSHPYFHSQLCTSFGGSSGHPTDCLLISPAWLPERIPALPLNATEPLGLLACLLVGLYGIKAPVAQEMNRVPEYARALRCIWSPP